MKLIASQTVIRYLVELEEDEVLEIEGSELAAEISRPEGADGRPRLWVEGMGGLGDLIDACLGQEEANDFYRMLEQLEQRKN